MVRTPKVPTKGRLESRDAVEWLTASRRLPGAHGSDEPALETRKSASSLLVVSTVLTFLLFGCLARLWWLSQESAARTPFDNLTLPVALTSLLLLILSVLGWDRLNQRALADVKAQSQQEIADTRHAGEARLAALMSSTSDVVLVLDSAFAITYSSGTSVSLLGRTPDHLHGRRVDTFLTEESGAKLLTALPGLGMGMQLRLELQAHHTENRVFPVELTVSSHLRDASVAGYVVSVRDLSQVSQFAAKLAKQALLDPMTNLPNRRHFLTQVAKELRSGGEGTVVAVINLVDFKAVNAGHSHAVGDEVLAEVGRRLTAIGGDVVPMARVGGDEFAVLLYAEYAAETTSLTEVICSELTRPITVSGATIILRISLGIAEATAGLRADDLLQQADAAMRSQAGGVVKYEPALHHKVIDRLALRQELEKAIRENHLHLEYQPLVDLKTGVVHGLEALVRWDHCTRGRVAPDEFVTLAEQSGLMIELGDWILREACAAAGRLQTPGHPVRISVNVSAVQLVRPNFVVDLLGILEEVNLDPNLLLLEITETAVVVGLDAVIPGLEALRSLGVHVAMDDFGTGYSSLNYLSRLPLDELKIDKSFVDRLPDDPQTESVVRGMLEMSNQLGLFTVGEGVESEYQAEWLRRNGVTLGQGYLFSKPLPEHRVAEVIHRLARVPAQTIRSVA